MKMTPKVWNKFILRVQNTKIFKDKIWSFYSKVDYLQFSRLIMKITYITEI